VVAWCQADDGEPITVYESSFDPGRLLTLRTRNSAAYKGIYAVLMKGGSKDWVYDQDITMASLDELQARIEQHHVEFDLLVSDSFDAFFDKRRDRLLDLIADAMGKAISLPSLPTDRSPGVPIGRGRARGRHRRGRRVTSSYSWPATSLGFSAGTRRRTPARRPPRCDSRASGTPTR
jgi:hypothetical protein